MFLIGALLGAIMGISGLIVLLSVTGVSILQFLIISLNQLVLLISLTSLKSYFPYEGTTRNKSRLNGNLFKSSMSGGRDDRWPYLSDLLDILNLEWVHRWLRWISWPWMYFYSCCSIITSVASWSSGTFSSTLKMFAKSDLVQSKLLVL